MDVFNPSCDKNNVCTVCKNGNEKAYELKNVCFKYEQEPVLENVNLDICTGDYIGIIGANGGGKTTLLKLLTGEQSPESGKILFFGKENINRAVQGNVGYVPQLNPTTGQSFPILCKELVALEFVQNKRFLPFLTAKDKEKIHYSMSHLGVENLSNRNFHELSGGQKQRVLIAKALINEPRVLLFDEPTVGIDENSKEDFFAVLNHLNEVHNITIIMVTHETELGRKHWNRTICVRNHTVEELC